ncbi:HlyD family efflux transporter periplasmic adaptor subunit (plasmid) [Hymenobacter sp. BRD128]|uniref:HlyD family efflux transporter periplasmic adaptor subunit n=1 Tax=Hymenobacter sp. BRD128 TaxID=2675878 RepID=UPI001563D4E9|nr:HlyD family efflux transporter periplasmic adaptor subunit [Hymenobacter sp. BRD128]QKG59137.1 HlyD family efflux transporter periplasmic adaptor subunit [Hymenobacter sp. BRD128]
MHQSSDFIELRAEEVQEILARPPKWLLRWGITGVFLLVVIIFIGTWMVRYPDLVHASFRLIATNAPKAVVTRTDGKVIHLFVQDGQQVQVGAPLAHLESNASYAEVLWLGEELQSAWHFAQNGELEKVQLASLASYHELGELQAAFQTFEQANIRLKSYLAGGFFSKKKALLQKELSDLQELSKQLRRERLLQFRDAKLAQQDYDVQRGLASQKGIASLELKREASKNIERQLAYEQMASTLINNTSAQRAKQKELLEIDREFSEKRSQFLQALNSLQSALVAWKAKYILIAPVSGRVFFTGLLQESQVVALNQELFYVAPESTGYLGELLVPQRNAGKVRVGQEVLVRFAGFPYQEFGFVKGRITTIADIPLKDSVFLAKVVLSEGLKTSYGKSLVYKTGMTASADIITADSRLLQKLFYQFRKATDGR